MRKLTKDFETIVEIIIQTAVSYDEAVAKRIVSEKHLDLMERLSEKSVISQKRIMG